LHIAADPFGGGVFEYAYRLQHELALRGHPQPMAAQRVLQRTIHRVQPTSPLLRSGTCACSHSWMAPFLMVTPRCWRPTITARCAVTASSKRFWWSAGGPACSMLTWLGWPPRRAWLARQAPAV